ncbi:MAG: response regulator [Anaerolineae bacterium]|nr:response regulator [Anaerolineae bacterium]
MSKKHEGRLLIIEDDDELNTMLSTYFQMQGYEVYNAFTGRDGVQLARQKLPNLILLDVMLPDLDGFDVYRALRGINRTRYIPVTFLTQRDGRSDKVAGLQLGADDYITKPFDLEELRLRVRRSIKRAVRDLMLDPRTGLPSRPVVVERLKELNTKQTGYRFLSGRIENLSCYREIHGFVATDEVMGFAARTLIEGIERHGTDDDFIGHLGDAQFAIVTYLKDVGLLAATLEAQFNDGITMFYNFIEREQGYISIEDDDGNVRQVPLMHLHVEQTDLSTELLQST